MQLDSANDALPEKNTSDAKIKIFAIRLKSGPPNLSRCKAPAKAFHPSYSVLYFEFESAISGDGETVIFVAGFSGHVARFSAPMRANH